MSTKFLSPGWRMPRNANQSKSSNYSLNFDGSNYISITDDPLKDGATNFTLSAWVKANGTVGGSDISFLQNWVSPHVFIIRYKEPNGNFQLYLNGAVKRIDVALSSLGLVNNNWNHIVLVNEYDNSQIKVYVNGTLQHTETSTQVAYPSNSTPLKIGGDYNYWDGQIDGVSIFDYALSQSQVTTLWGGGTSVSNPMALPSPPIAYYPLGTSAWNGDYLAENNAIGDYVFDFPATDAVQSNFTLFNGASEACISAWFKTDVQQSGKCLFSTPFSINGNKFDLYFQSAGFSSYLKTVTNISNIASSTINYYDNKWHNVIVTYDGVNHKIYYDGNEVATAARSGVLADSTYNKLEIGRFGTSFSNNVDAKISNVLAWTKGLSSSEAETLYNYGSPIRTLANIPQNSNLKAWYKLDASEIYNSSITDWEINNAVSSYNNSLFVDNLLQPSTSTNGITMGSYNDTAGLSAVSWSLWVNLKTLNSASGYSTMINGNSFSFSTNGGGGGLGGTDFNSRFVNSSGSFIDNSFTLSTALQSQGWVNIIATYDGANAKFYLNTEQKGIKSGSGVLNTTSSLNLGYSYGTNSVDARFSNFSIWNKALTTSDISEIYNSGVPGDLASHSSTSNLLNWWKLNNLSSGLQDSKGSSNATTTGTSGSTTVQPGSVSALNGESLGMSQANLVQSDLQTVAPYSKYALSFDGSNDQIDTNSNLGISGASPRTFSAWMKTTDGGNGWHVIVATGYSSNVSNNFELDFRNNVIMWERWGLGITGSVVVNDGNWHHACITYDGNILKLYVDGSEDTAGNFPYTIGATTSTDTPVRIGGMNHNAKYFNGSISNVSIWNAALTSSQVREIYNEGLPSNLNSHSAYSNLISWWQLGSNSSWNGSRWIVADEKGTNNGYSQNMAPYMPESGLTNGVGTTANGTSTGMAVGALVGDAPYSTGNVISVNMGSTARGTDIPPTP